MTTSRRGRHAARRPAAPLTLSPRLTRIAPAGALLLATSAVGAGALSVDWRADGSAASRPSAQPAPVKVPRVELETASATPPVSHAYARPSVRPHPAPASSTTTPESPAAQVHGPAAQVHAPVVHARRHPAEAPAPAPAAAPTRMAAASTATHAGGSSGSTTSTSSSSTTTPKSSGASTNVVTGLVDGVTGLVKGLVGGLTASK